MLQRIKNIPVIPVKQLINNNLLIPKENINTLALKTSLSNIVKIVVFCQFLSKKVIKLSFLA